MWEPGFWNLTDREAVSFRAYLLKGGFAVFEDIDGLPQWSNFEAQMRRVLPEGRFVKCTTAALGGAHRPESREDGQAGRSRRERTSSCATFVVGVTRTSNRITLAIAPGPPERPHPSSAA
jgi:hypothetical protein